MKINLTLDFSDEQLRAVASDKWTKATRQEMVGFIHTVIGAAVDDLVFDLNRNQSRDAANLLTAGEESGITSNLVDVADACTTGSLRTLKDRRSWVKDSGDNTRPPRQMPEYNPRRRSVASSLRTCKHSASRLSF
jgi:hypothetical protein